MNDSNKGFPMEMRLYNTKKEALAAVEESFNTPGRYRYRPYMIIFHPGGPRYWQVIFRDQIRTLSPSNDPGGNS